MKAIYTVLATFIIIATLVDGQLWLQSYKFKFYWSNGVQDYNSNNLQSIRDNANFNPANPTVLYFYGVTQNPTSTNIVLMRNAYISAGYNFILFDVNAFYYSYAFIDPITTRIAEDLITSFKAGLSPSNFQIVGFSFGAQCAGYVARKVNSKSSGAFTVPRIVGLEPAILSPVKLSSSDAAFVMTVHTGVAFSDSSVIGHVGFFPNGGIAQPMCNRRILFATYNDASCSHSQVQLFWIEAVQTQSATVFPARKCNNAADFNNRQCDLSIPIDYMNLKTSNTLRGNYYFSTFNSSPYSRATADP